MEKQTYRKYSQFCFKVLSSYKSFFFLTRKRALLLSCTRETHCEICTRHVFINLIHPEEIFNRYTCAITVLLRFNKEQSDQELSKHGYANTVAFQLVT